MQYLASIFLPLLLLATSCSEEDTLDGSVSDCSNVSITFVNQLGVDIDALLIEGSPAQSLRDGEASDFYCIDEVFGYLPEEPWVDFMAVTDTETHCSIAQLFWCGTGATTSSEGSFVIVLDSIQSIEVDHLTCTSFVSYSVRD